MLYILARLFIIAGSLRMGTLSYYPQIFGVKPHWFSKPDVMETCLPSAGVWHMVWDLILLLLHACGVPLVCDCSPSGLVPNCISTPSTLFTVPLIYD